MPGFGTTDRTHTNALRLMESLGVGIREISIREACAVHFRDIGMDDADRSVAYENAQARERTQILMDLANRTGGLVIGTGDLSELALGWATYNGDHMSMYGVNCGVPKTLVRHLVRWVAAHPDYEVARGGCSTSSTPLSVRSCCLPTKRAKSYKRQKTWSALTNCTTFFCTISSGSAAARPNSISWPAGRSPENTTRNRQKVADRILTAFLLATVQTIGIARRAESGIGQSVAPRDWRMPSDASPAMWIREAESL